MSKPLNKESANRFKEFEGVSVKEWKQKIQFDLKGADYNETLVWQNLDGIHVKPFYHQDDFKDAFTKIPGQPKHWLITQDVFIDDAKIANKIALDAINRGAEAILFTSEKEFDIKVVFSEFTFEKTAIHFNLKFLSETFVEKLIQFFSDKKNSVYYNIDIIGNLVKAGNWFTNLKDDHQRLDAILNKNSDKHILSVDAAIYQNAGGNNVQQLAYALAHCNEYLNHTSNLLGKEDMEKVKMTFQIAVGSNYFFEIAKIRAFRKLYATLAKEYGAEETCHILATPSKRNKTIYDYNVNMLRTTTESMSAVLGGADSVCNLPYDALYHKSNEFGERISRNQLLILKHESYFDAVCNPADGTYYIESLTTELAEKALLLFKEIEKDGGFLKQLKEGLIQRKIKESAEKEQNLYNSGEIKLLGTNFHPNKNDRMKDDLELYPFLKRNPIKTLIEPIFERRLSQVTEQERLKTEL